MLFKVYKQFKNRRNNIAESLHKDKTDIIFNKQEYKTA